MYFNREEPPSGSVNKPLLLLLLLLLLLILLLFWNTMMFDPFDQTFSQRWRKLKTYQREVGLGVSLNGDIDWVK